MNTLLITLQAGGGAMQQIIPIALIMIVKRRRTCSYNRWRAW
jgi:hypothetical protein